MSQIPTAPETSETIELPFSDMEGIKYKRLYLAIRSTAMSSMLASKDSIFGVGVEGVTTLFTMVDCIAYAVAVEVALEIHNHSKLEAAQGMRDTGTAGAGIIGGWLK
jgi:hypothetical protein